MPMRAMRNAAANNSCVWSCFAQDFMIPRSIAGEKSGSSGICFGLAVTWLESKMSGDYKGFIGNVVDRHHSNIFSRAHLIWRNQSSHMWCELTGLNFVGEREIHETKDLVNWVKGSYGRRYFIILVHRHAMAAWGSKLEGISFFDPNAGIVSSKNSDDMAKCLADFFAVPYIKAAYEKPSQNKVTLTVKKFKSAHTAYSAY